MLFAGSLTLAQEPASAPACRPHQTAPGMERQRLRPRRMLRQLRLRRPRNRARRCPRRQPDGLGTERKSSSENDHAACGGAVADCITPGSLDTFGHTSRHRRRCTWATGDPDEQARAPAGDPSRSAGSDRDPRRAMVRPPAPPLAVRLLADCPFANVALLEQGRLFHRWWRSVTHSFGMEVNRDNKRHTARRTCRPGA